MRQIIQSYKRGKISLTEVPVPACKAGGADAECGLAHQPRHREDDDRDGAEEPVRGDLTNIIPRG